MSIYRLLADAVLILHVCIVLFVIVGLLLVVIGNVRKLGWVNNVWFRLAHLASIGIVVAQAWLGVICPLTTLEMWLREKAGESTYAGSFIEHWLQRLLYYQAPPWVFIAAYTAFGLAVIASWWFYPPRRKRRSTS